MQPSPTKSPLNPMNTTLNVKLEGGYFSVCMTSCGRSWRNLLLMGGSVKRGGGGTYESLWSISTEERLAWFAWDGIEVEPKSFVSADATDLVFTTTALRRQPLHRPCLQSTSSEAAAGGGVTRRTRTLRKGRGQGRGGGRGVISVRRKIKVFEEIFVSDGQL